MSKDKPSHKTETSIPMSERVREASKRLGMRMAEKDDPIYNEPATVYFSSLPGKSTPDGKADSEKPSQPDGRPTPEEIQAVINERMRHGT